MRFTINGKTYVIEFSRSYGVVKDRTIEIELETDTPNVVEVKAIPLPTRNPYTTATLMEETLHREGDTVIVHRTPFRTATVGCYHKEKFSLEKGRLRALREICRTIEGDDLKKALFEAYFARKRG